MSYTTNRTFQKTNVCGNEITVGKSASRKTEIFIINLRAEIKISTKYLCLFLFCGRISAEFFTRKLFSRLLTGENTYGFGV